MWFDCPYNMGFLVSNIFSVIIVNICSIKSFCNQIVVCRHNYELIKWMSCFSWPEGDRPHRQTNYSGQISTYSKACLWRLKPKKGYLLPVIFLSILCQLERVWRPREWTEYVYRVGKYCQIMVACPLFVAPCSNGQTADLSHLCNTF